MGGIGSLTPPGCGGQLTGCESLLVLRVLWVFWVLYIFLGFSIFIHLDGFLARFYPEALPEEAHHRREALVGGWSRGQL
jgi:hypothetical protein